MPLAGAAGVDLHVQVQLGLLLGASSPRLRLLGDVFRFQIVSGSRFSMSDMILCRRWSMQLEKGRAGDGIRTHDNDVGNVVLYQLSYTRTANHAAAPAVRGIPKL